MKCSCTRLKKPVLLMRTPSQFLVFPHRFWGIYGPALWGTCGRRTSTLNYGAHRSPQLYMTHKGYGSRSNETANCVSRMGGFVDVVWVVFFLVKYFIGPEANSNQTLFARLHYSLVFTQTNWPNGTCWGAQRVLVAPWAHLTLPKMWGVIYVSVCLGILRALST